MPSHDSAALGLILPWASVLPFLAFLLTIAILPLKAPHWWEHNGNRAAVSAVVALPFAGWLYVNYGVPALEALGHSLLDYVSFIALIGSLFVISGGIHVRGSLSGTPLSNTVLLGLGALLANLIGTTGASTLLIRPLLRANESRHRKTHIIIFFIFVVANCGGLLTPLGDPPLFLGFLRGVPFAWTFGLWKPWLLVVTVLLATFNVMDQFVLDREERDRPRAQLEAVMVHEPLRIDGLWNLVPLAGIVLVIMGRGYGWGLGGRPWPFGIQETAMIGLAAASYLRTPRTVHRANRFSFGPIIEVAVIFAGIFVTMVAPLLILNARGASLGLREPWQYFWATGMLSSFLDNAPTYLTFAAAAAGRVGVLASEPQFLGELLARSAEGDRLLAAVSCGAVFMGANTYIGNGPNFIVKAIAEEHGIRMPSFLGYVVYSSVILLPAFVVVTLVFFR